MRAPTECPVCGGNVPSRSRSCPHCGADERTGWNTDDTRYDGLDLPDEAYEDPDAPAPRRRSPRAGLHPLWWLVALGVLGLLALGSLLPWI